MRPPLSPSPADRQHALLAAALNVLVLDLAADSTSADSADAVEALAALRNAVADIDPRIPSALMAAAFTVLEMERLDRTAPGMEHKYEYALLALRAAAHDIDPSIEPPARSLIPYNVWTNAFCATWDDLVHGQADAMDLADWAEALYTTNGQRDPYQVAKTLFDQSEL